MIIKYDGQHIIYLDHLGYKTFGYGTLATEWDEEYDYEVGTVVSQERVDECFDKFLKVCIKDCRTIYPNFDKLPEEAQRILANMSYNLGFNRLKGFQKLQASIVDKDFARAAIEMQDSNLKVVGSNPTPATNYSLTFPTKTKTYR